MTYKRVEALVLSEEDIHGLVTFPEALRMAEEELKNQGLGNVDMPPKVALELRRFGLDSYCNSMPAYLHYKDILGIKYGGGFGRNIETGDLPYMVQTLLLANPRTGELKAIMSATHLTVLKTGTETAVAGKFLAKQTGPLIVCVIGVGDQGQGNARSWAALDTLGDRDVQEIKLVDLDLAKLEAFAPVLEQEYSKKITISDNIEASVGDCNVLVTTTTSPKPIVRKEWVAKHGVFFGSLGSDPELEESIILEADKIIADNWIQNEHRGEFKKLIREGKIGKDQLHAELPAIVAGEAAGRESDDETIVASLIGLGAIDIAIAADILPRALELGIGQTIRLF